MESKKYIQDYPVYLYDLVNVIDDIDFYKSFIGDSVKNVLELGCGSGRVLIPLAKMGINITGIDISDSMLEGCRSKVKKEGLTKTAKVIRGDICNFELHDKFDMIVAPFRVIQALETLEEFQNCLKCVSEHLKDDGFCILGIFRPRFSKEQMAISWINDEPLFNKELIDPATGYMVRDFAERLRMDAEKQVLYPELIYKIYRDGKLIDEIRQKIVMKYYYADEFEKIISKAGFKVLDKYGGYHGEMYGEGDELIIKFSK